MPKRSRLQIPSGFTLIELLVAMVLAVLVITPLLGFMINIIDNDHREQAKAASEQEIQAAVDYITQDLEQAVYIYDADGLSNNSTDNPPGIRDQIPPIAKSPNCNDASTCVPVVVFWKREFKKQAIQVTGSISSQKNDSFVYSLVAYYLIKDNSSTWSKAARIARFEIKDGVRNPDNSNNYVDENDPELGRSIGFKPFDLKLPGTLKEKMDRWTNSGETYTARANVLVDYIDQSTNAPPPVDCQKALAQNPTQPKQQAQRVPPDSINPLKINSFYACVDSSPDKNLVRVFIRGNALARINEGTTYNSSRSVYFPTASTQGQGHGLLNEQ